MKRTAGVLVAVFVFMLVATMVVAGGPDVIELNKVQKSMAPVSFKHAEHQTRAENCQVCHHKSKAEDTELKSCAECHGKDEAAPSYKDALHKGCQPCHKEQKAAGKNPPTKCKECHVK